MFDAVFDFDRNIKMAAVGLGCACADGARNAFPRALDMSCGIRPTLGLIEGYELGNSH